MGILGAATEVSGNAGVQLAHTFGVQPALLLAQVLNFCLVAYLLYRFGLKPTLEKAEERRSEIAKGLQDAADAKAQLASAQEERLHTLAQAQQEAQTLLAKTKEDCEHYATEQTQATEAKMARLLEQSKSAFEADRAQLRAEVRQEAATLAVTTAEQLLQSVLTDEMRQKLNQKATELFCEKEAHGTQA